MVYNPLTDDKSVGGSDTAGQAGQPTGSAGPAQPYNPLTSDQTVGGSSSTTSTQNQDDGGFLQRTWKTISDFGTGVAHTASALVQGVTDPNKSDARNAGFDRGVRDVTDKQRESNIFSTGITSPGYIPGAAPSFWPIKPPLTPDEVNATKNQNALDRAAWDKQWGSDPVATAYRGTGNAAASAPFVLPLAGAGELALGAGAGALADITGIAAKTGFPGFALRTGITAAERSAVGAGTGGAEAAAASDPSKDFWDQVRPAMEAGAILAPPLGIVGDVAGNAVQRLRGNYVPVNPFSGQQFGDITEKAANAQTLLDNKVPVFASQVSGDPTLQFTSRWGTSLPYSGIRPAVDDQLENFRSSILKRVNPDAAGRVTNATDKFVTDANTAIGDKYNKSIGAVPRVESLYTDTDPVTGATRTSTIHQDFADARAKMSVPNKSLNDRLDAIENDFAAAQGGSGGANTGAITGQQAQDIIQRSESSLSKYLNSTDPDVVEAAKAAQDAIRKRAMAAMTQDQRDLYQQANQQYRALNTVTAVKDANGSFTPGALNDEALRVKKQFGGTGILDDLAKAGDSVIQPTLDAAPPTLGWKVAGGGVAGAPPSLAAIAAAKAVMGGGLASVGSGTAVGGGLAVALNRLIQRANRIGGQNAVNAVRAGGVAPPGWIMGPVGPTALNTQTLLGSSLDTNQPQPQR